MPPKKRQFHINWEKNWRRRQKKRNERKKAILQKPIDSDDEGDVLCGQADGVEHHHHGDQTSLRDAGCANARGGWGDAEEWHFIYSLSFTHSNWFCLWRAPGGIGAAGPFILYLMAMMLPSESGTFRTCEMKIAATASYNAVPSMLMVAPMGITKRATRGSTPFLSSSAAIATGRVAELGGAKKNKFQVRINK